MSDQPIHYHWQTQLQASPEALWPYVADTNRFNRDTGLPRVERLGITGGVSQMRFRLPLLNVTWDENPFEWVYPYRFGILRIYHNGPFRQMRVLCELEPTPAGGTDLRYQVWVTPRGLWGGILTQIGIGMVSAPRFINTFKHYDTLAASGQQPLAAPGLASLAPGGMRRLGEIARRLSAEQNQPAEIVRRLGDLIQHGDDLSLARMRPYALADYWNSPRRATLETFLCATREGLLDLRWELICPMCRGAAESVAHLSEIHAESHCPSCQIDFTANFDRQVEVTFRPNPAIRILPTDLLFCVGNPQSEPHIHIAQTIAPGETLSLGTVLEQGEYSLGLYSATGEKTLRLVAQPNGLKQVEIRADAPPAARLEVDFLPVFRVENPTSSPIEMMLQRSDWSNQAATAADITSLQIFRDLFSSEALRSGEELSISSVTLMFTDLRDSTRLYRQIGDARAFGRVREHFDFLEQAIAAEGGAIVKTMGDAVMAVFRQPVGALRAIKTAHAEITRAEGTPPLYLKVGLHSGACIAVTLNERLDYFGSTVNAAARLPGLAEGGEVVMTGQVFNDPEVAEWLAQRGANVQSFKTTVKGFDQPFELWRYQI